ncbi:MAG: TIGR03084 family metal-binding protein [Pseudarthrobacter sp.]
MAVPLSDLIQDWHDETAGLENILSQLTAEEWQRPTPAPGWDVGHQIAHLTWTDKALLQALSSPTEFAVLRDIVTADVEGTVNEAAAAGARVAPKAILNNWVSGQRRTAELLSGVDPTLKLPWFGPPMGPAAAISARIMETFAHGQDVRDALGLPPIRSPRLRHIAHLAVAARPYSFHANGLQEPSGPVRVELDFNGQIWTWGPEDAVERVTGDALDFALMATRRRHWNDCDVRAAGNEAQKWLEVIQAYAGPPGTGRKPLRQESTRIR